MSQLLVAQVSISALILISKQTETSCCVHLMWWLFSCSFPKSNLHFWQEDGESRLIQFFWQRVSGDKQPTGTVICWQLIISNTSGRERWPVLLNMHLSPYSSPTITSPVLVSLGLDSQDFLKIAVQIIYHVHRMWCRVPQL